MHFTKPKTQVGVLNMAISLQKTQLQPKSSINHHQTINISPIKYQNIPLFIPKCTNRRYQYQHNQQQLSPYQNYIRIQKQSIRYFREHSQHMKDNQNQIIGLSPVNKNKNINKSIKQINLKQSFQQQKQQNKKVESTFNINFNNNQLKLISRRKISKNYDNNHTQDLKNDPTLYFNLSNHKNSIDEQSLRNIFTVRSIKTSRNDNRLNPQKRKQKRINNTPVVKRQRVMAQRSVEVQAKRIRPWSTSRNVQNKIAIQSMLVVADQMDLQDLN